MIILGDPDIFVTWLRIDEPGDNLKWESQCGYIEQIGYGNNTMFQGFVGPEKTPIEAKENLSIVKKIVEEAFKKQRELVWQYEQN